MGFVPFADTVRAEMIYSWSGQVCENVLHFSTLLGWEPETMEQLAAALLAEWNITWKPRTSNTCLLMKIKLTDMSTANGPSFDYSVGMPSAGTMTSASMPNNVTVAVKLNTHNRGRSYRGRLYHIGMTAEQVVNSTLAPGLSGAWATWYAHYMNLAIEGAAPKLVVCSRVSEGVERAQGVVTVVTGITIDETLDSQRRRLPGRGR